MSAAVQALVRPEPKRDRFGRYLINGKPYTRATTWAKTLDDSFGLQAWMQRMVALGLAKRPDLLARVAATRLEEKKQLDKICDDAREVAAASAGANHGIALHAFTERIDLGEDVAVPAPWDADVAAYRKALVEAGIEIDTEWVERILFCPELGVAGTIDRLVTHQGKRRIADIKSGSVEYAWGSIAVQLALYANSPFAYDIATDSTSDCPDIDREVGLVVHLPVGQATCTIYEVDLVAGWEAAQLAGAVRAWRKRKNLARPHTGPMLGEEVAPFDDRAAWVRCRVTDIVGMGHGQDLALGWPAGVPTLKSEHQHTTAELDAIANLCDEVEGAHRMPFPADSDPDAVDEGRKATKDELEEIRALVESLMPEAAATVKFFAGAAADVDRNISLSKRPSLRRLEVARLLVALSQYPVTEATDLLTAFSEAEPDEPIGLIVGRLTIDQARAFRGLLEMTTNQPTESEPA